MKTAPSLGLAAMALGMIAWSTAAPAPSVTARLVDKNRHAGKGAAIVEVAVRGLRLVDPASVSVSRDPVAGHLHYRLDDGAVVATSASTLSFHEMAPGEHKISVSLTDGNHVPIGKPVVMTVTVPTSKAVYAY